MSVCVVTGMHWTSGSTTRGSWREPTTCTWSSTPSCCSWSSRRKSCSSRDAWRWYTVCSERVTGPVPAGWGENQCMQIGELYCWWWRQALWWCVTHGSLRNNINYVFFNGIAGLQIVIKKILDTDYSINLDCNNPIFVEGSWFMRPANYQIGTAISWIGLIGVSKMSRWATST